MPEPSHHVVILVTRVAHVPAPAVRVPSQRDAPDAVRNLSLCAPDVTFFPIDRLAHVLHIAMTKAMNALLEELHQDVLQLCQRLDVVWHWCPWLNQLCWPTDILQDK